MVVSSFVKKRTLSRSNTSPSCRGELSHSSLSSLRRSDSFYGAVAPDKLRKPLKQSNAEVLNITAIGVRRWQIDPRISKAMPFWDVVTSAAILFTAFVTPYEVALLPMAVSVLEPLFLINRVLDVIFIADMYVQFVLIYSVGSSAEGLRWVEDPWLVARNYLKGWFTIDATSIAVSAVDLVGLQQGGNSNVESLRTLRVLRALRLLKLARLLRASRIFARWETKVAIDYAMLELVKCVGALVAASHWFGCVWALQASLVSASTLDSWLGETGYCVPNPGGIVSGSCPAGYVCQDEPGVACLPHGTIYAASVYWAVMTITSIGYGDVAATPYNAPEQIIGTILMLLSGILWGYVIGTFCGAIANLSPQTYEFRRNMDDLNSYIAMHGVDRELGQRLREYFHQARHLVLASSHQRLLGLMSPKLQRDTVLAVNKNWHERVWFLADEAVEREFVVRLTLTLAPLVLAPFELCPHGYLYILHRGVAVHMGAIVTKGSTWGEDILIASMAPNLVRGHNARAMNYAEVFVVDLGSLMAPASGFPRSKRHLRRCALRLALRREFVRLARLARREEQKQAEKEGRGAGRGASVLTRAGTSSGPMPLERMLYQSTKSCDADVALQQQLIDSIEAHERISRRVEEVQDEIEELEAQVEELMRMSRASRASRRASSAGDLAGQLPGPRRLSRAKSQVDSRQIGPETMHIGLPTNVRKTAGVAVGADGGFSVNAGDVRHVPKQLRKELGLLDISEPTPEQTTTAASVRVGADGRFEFDGKISEQMRLVLEDIERAKGLPPRKS